MTDLPHWTEDLVASAALSGERIGDALELCRRFGSQLDLPGLGRTAQRWAVMRELGRANLTVARVFEAHTDALAILAEAGEPSAADTGWGVFAAEAPNTRLDAQLAHGMTTLTGVKPWCSLGADLDRALVTAHIGDERGLYAVDLHDESVRADAPEGWVARGLRTVTSVSLRFDATPAIPVGAPGWYLSRPGFAWGGLGVAACWFGGALGLADAVRRTARTRGGELNALHVGIVDSTLHACAAVLAQAAIAVDSGTAEPALLSLRVRAVVADAVERVLRQAGHALGPAPLAFDERHAARVADLGLYVRQHHGERDLAELGRLVLGGDG